MSRKHPVVVITGSSGAGTTTVKKALEAIFYRQKINPVVIEGDSFHRYDREGMQRKVIEANQADIKNEVGNFHSYIAGGDLHTILGRPEFYSYQVNGTSLRDWVAKLVNGEAISDVHCSDCSQPELIAGSISAH